MAYTPPSWHQRLTQQRQTGLWRAPAGKPTGFADFCSNDFLGLGQQALAVPATFAAGATGSRHISGMHGGLQELESWAANFWQAERAVYFPTGFQGNLAVVQALATRHDTILLDERIHASLRDAARGSLAQTHYFKHNSLEALEDWLQKAIKKLGDIYVVSEGVFSMTGTQAPLAAMAALCTQHKAIFMVDEAHSLGLHGAQGRGLVHHLGLEKQVPVQLYPLGKAAGCQGSLVVGSAVLGQMLDNFARPLIYSTAPAPVLVWAAQNRLEALQHADYARTRLAAVEAHVQTFLPNALPGAVLPVCPTNPESWPALLAGAQEAKLWVKPIRYPTVPKGEECLRITLHANQTHEELERLEAWVRKYHLKALRVAAGSFVV